MLYSRDSNSLMSVNCDFSSNFSFFVIVGDCLLDCLLILAVLDGRELKEAEGRRCRSRGGAAQARGAAGGRSLSDSRLRDAGSSRRRGGERQEDHGGLSVHLANVHGVESNGRHCVDWWLWGEFLSR